jgi:murein L,D-transpeptidase YcbB/YkuD
MRVTASTGADKGVSEPEVRVLMAERNTLPVILGGLVDSLSAYYVSGRSHVWCRNGHLEDRAEAMIEVLQSAAAEGLDPESYGVERLEDLARRLRNGEKRLEPEFEVLLSGYSLLYARDVSSGRVDPKASGIPWHTKKAEVPSLDLLEQMAEASPGELRKLMASLPPVHEQYRALREQLARYIAIRKDGGWPSVPGGPAVRTGESIARNRRSALEARLQREGHLDARVESGEGGKTLEAGLGECLRRFQELRGLEPDGVLGPRTVEELNQSVEVRIETITANMERWRWVPADLGGKYIHVNTAAFQLEARNAGHTDLRLRVIVGKQGWSTPAFSDLVTSIVFNPVWNVPANIATEEVIPRIREDRKYLENNRMVVIDEATGETVDPGRVDWEKVASGEADYRIQQQPGPGNPLGKIKFLFPNAFSIYLHDTPKEELFERTDRAFSHGCIRVDRPLELAAFLLAPDEAWTKERILSAYESEERVEVRIQEAVPVYIFYWTAWVNEKGDLEFHQDHYGLDREQAARLPGNHRKGDES